MGLFDFVKNVGADLFGKDKDEAQAINKLITESLGGKIKNLQVVYEDGTVTLAGECDSQASREKAILLSGNVKGVENVIADQLSAPEEETMLDYYTVVSGDSLSKIAKRYYGDAMKYPVVFEANKEVIKDPNLIYPGQKLRIPDIK